jgi:alginate O-acetyltransferase complex protein AlgJ
MIRIPLFTTLVLTMLTTAAYADDARQAVAELVASAEQAEQIVLSGEDDWLFLTADARHAVSEPFWGEQAAANSRARKPEWADPLPVIVDMHKQLDALGIELILLPVATKAAIYPDKLAKDAAAPTTRERIDTADAAFYQKLRDQGVTVIDMTEAYLKQRRDAETAPTYCKTDTHWSGVGLQAAAAAVHEKLKDHDWVKALPDSDYQTQQRQVTIRGDLLRMQEDADEAATETLPLTFVGEPAGDRLSPIEPREDSPILLLADSHGLVFHSGADDMHAKGAGLADHLALKFGLPLDVIAVRGADPNTPRITLLRRSYREPAYLKNKKAIVWVFAARALTESDGWRPLPPLVKPSN